MFGPVFEQGFRYLPRLSLMDVIRSVSSGEAQWGVIPYFNSISGPVKKVYPALLDVDGGCFAGLTVLACVSYDVAHDLLSSGSVKSIKVVYSKREALEQCLNTLMRILPGVRTEDCPSTSEAARVAEREGPVAAAIASRHLLSLHDSLRLLAANVEDVQLNITRFIVIGRGKTFENLGARRDCHLQRHLWIVFASSIGDTILPEIVSRSYRWGLRSHILSGTVVEPRSLKTSYLMELAEPPSSLRVRFFLSETRHLSPAIIGAPVMVGERDAEELRRYIVSASDMAAFPLRCDSHSRQELDAQVLKILDTSVAFRLYAHPPVSTMRSVWEVLGVPVSKTLNTQICQDRATHAVAFCCVRGDRKIDVRKVSSLLSGEYCRIGLSELQAMGQKTGAISPLTAPPHAAVVIDQELESADILFMGSGRPDLSIAVDVRTGWPRPVRIGHIAQSN